jgi:hypothetical protein
LFGDLAETLANPLISGRAVLNRTQQLPNLQYDLYTATAAISQHYVGTVPTPPTNLHTFVHSVRPTIHVAGGNVAVPRLRLRCNGQRIGIRYGNLWGHWRPDT